MKSKKKVSIREYISEEDLRYQLYYYKLNKFYRRILTEGEEEIQKDMEKRKQKRIKRFNREIEKNKGTSDYNTIKHSMEENIKFIENTPKVTIETLEKDFQEVKEQYLEELYQRLDEEERSTKKKEIQEIIERVKKDTLDNYSKEIFGEMLLLLINNILNMPNFAGYTDNWKIDFISQAVEDMIQYADNFNHNILSKRTGKKSKAFAYCTQIIYSAFIKVINEKNKEQDMLTETITTESSDNHNTITIRGTKRLVQYQDIDLVIETKRDSLQQYFNIINRTNQLAKEDRILLSELKYLDSTTDENTKKSEEYQKYIKELESKISGFKMVKAVEFISSNEHPYIKDTYDIEYIIRKPGKDQNKDQNKDLINTLKEKEGFFDDWF